MEPVVPDEAAQELSEGPVFLPASRKNGIFQEIRLFFQGFKAPAAAGEDVPLVVRLHTDLPEIVPLINNSVVRVDIFTVKAT